jgi:hypothetical protein
MKYYLVQVALTCIFTSIWQNTLSGQETADQRFYREAKVSNANMYIRRGITKERRNDLDGAIANYDRAIEFNANDAGVYVLRGNSKLRSPTTAERSI